MGFSNKSEYFWMPTEEEISEKLYYYLNKDILCVLCVDTSLGSHAVVVDGYDGEGRFHINYGWGGKSDGYYTITECYSITSAVLPDGVKRSTSTSLSSIVNRPRDSSAVFNLQGQRVGNSLEGLPKGVYIKDGKKYIVK